MSNGNSTNFIKGMGLGLAVGAAGALIGKTVMTNTHSLAKGSAKVMKAVGDFVDGIGTMIK